MSYYISKFFNTYKFLTNEKLFLIKFATTENEVYHVFLAVSFMRNEIIKSDFSKRKSVVFSKLFKYCLFRSWHGLWNARIYANHSENVRYKKSMPFHDIPVKEASR